MSLTGDVSDFAQNILSNSDQIQSLKMLFDNDFLKL